MSAADDNFAASVKSIRIKRKPWRLLLVAAVIVALIAAGAVAGSTRGPAGYTD